jgi:predicted signal transduction protein with EAL and GGDEF domain
MLEVTESAFMDDAEAAAIALNGLSSLGVRIAIDDFGTGYSSLLYLRRYPITALKLDRAFVSGIGVSLNDEAICSSVVDLAHAVGATSIGEGVETVEQYSALRSLGCQQAQGFLWSPAVPVEQLAAVLLACKAVTVSPARTEPGRRRRTPRAPISADVAVRAHKLRRQGASSHTIAAALNAADLRTPDGSRWTAVAVAKYLHAA